MKRVLFAISALTFLTASYPSLSRADYLCRPRTKDVVQRVTQWMAYPETPICQTKIKIKEIRSTDYWQMWKKDMHFKAKDGSRYRVTRIRRKGQPKSDFNRLTRF